MRMGTLALAALGLCLSGCAEHYYNPATQNHVLAQHLQKIAVRPFANHTPRPGIEHKLTTAVHTAFNRDGRWQIVDEDQADGVLVGEITRYMLMPLKHDANNAVTEYKLWVLVDISFYDRTKNQTLWTERNMEAKLIAPPAATGLPGALTEVEAQEKLWDQLAKDIATRTFEGFGSVTGISRQSRAKIHARSKPPAAALA